MRHLVGLLWVAIAALLLSFVAACGSDEGGVPGTPLTSLDAASPTNDGSTGVDSSTPTDGGSGDGGSGDGGSGDGGSGDADSGTPAAPTITSFTVADDKITTGSDAKLTAVFSGGTGSIDQGVGAVTSNVVASSGALTANKTFTLTVTNSAGVSVTAQVTVQVFNAAVIDAFTANKTKVTVGQTVDLTADFSGGTATVDNGVGAVQDAVAKTTGAIAVNTTFTLTVTNEAGDSVTAQVTVNAYAAPSITSFVAAASEVSRGATTTVTGVFAGGAGSVDQGVGAVTSGNATATTAINGNVTFTLTVTNEAGASVTATANVTRKKELYVSSYATANGNAGTIAVFDYDASGNATPKRRIAGVSPALTGPRGLFVVNDEIVVAQGNGVVSTFDVLDTGNVAPKRRLTGGNTTFDQPVAAFVVAGEMFVGNEDGKLLVFDPALTGNVAPKRTLTGAATMLSTTHYPVVDNGELYVSNYGSGTVTVYPATAFGDTAPTRTITTNTNPIACTVDGNELIVSHRLGSIISYDKNTGAVLRTINGASTQMDTTWTEQVAVYKDEIYAAAYNTQKVLVFPRNANGNVAPTRVITGANTLFADPIGLFIY